MFLFYVSRGVHWFLPRLFFQVGFVIQNGLIDGLFFLVIQFFPRSKRLKF